MKNIFEKISNAYYTLTNSEKKAADYVLAHRSETSTLSIGDLSSECDVAEATISRFCRKLGCKNFTEFKLEIAGASIGKAPENDMLSGEVQQADNFYAVAQKLYSEECSVIRSTMELLDEKVCKTAVEWLSSADRVFCMGQGGSMLLANEAAHLFSTVCGKFYPVADSHLQTLAITTMTERDLIFFFSYSGATRDLLDTLNHAHKRGVKVMLVTRFPKSPGAVGADLVLRCGAAENPLQLGSVGARVSQMYLLEVLFTEFCRRDLNAARESRARIAEALSDKHVEK